ncbi:MAG: aminotransferase class I/II-fold pyridoxal phosphate-dependent enzyme [Saprospiraceae bacterium]|nr:aminotransferase class I/II-fold pyridoxal phosphate-dependent enzyme [Saprospiraceae bacterium]
MATKKHVELSEILNHLGEERSQYFNAVSPPIIQTSNFAFRDTASFRGAFLDERAHHLYSRGNNPTTEILRKKIAALEKTEDALVFGSGAAAMACGVIANVRSGDHIICVQNPYSWTYKLVSQLLPRFDVAHTFVAGDSVEEIERTLTSKTRFLILESPNSITFKLQDLSACAELCKRHQVISLIDNSYASPLFQNPADFGIDIVMHTCSKYLNGHSDVVAGVLCGKKTMMDKIFLSEFMTLGSVLAPHDAALIIRGLRTLEIRMQRMSDSALRVAKFLQGHPKVEQVIHPFLKSFAQYQLARTQMRGCGGLFSFLVKANNKDQVNAMVDRLKTFLLAVSWGGHESLVLPFSIFHDIPGQPDPVYPFNLVRIYVGLEDPQYLIADLAQALEIL